MMPHATPWYPPLPEDRNGRTCACNRYSPTPPSFRPPGDYFKKRYGFHVSSTVPT